MTAAISAKDLGKRYILSHQKQERYVALRDVIARNTRRFAHKVRHPFIRPSNDSEHEEFWALRDVDFDIQQGDRVGIIGRNGAGKSTLLKILSRITEPTAGQVSIRGRVASLLEVGTGFHPELTGRENIFLNGAILGMSRGEIINNFDEIVAFAEVEKFLDTPVKHYSSGMYVRLAFSVAAHLQPDILILDEVLAVGDSQFQKKCLGKIEEVGNQGRTILFVSHNMGMINALCNKGIFLENGRVAAIGEVGDVLSQYQHKAISALDCCFERRDPVGKRSKASLLKASVCGPKGEPAPTLFIDQPSSIQIEWQLNIDVPFLRVGIEIVDSSAAVVATCLDTDSTDLFGKPRSPGVYKEVMKIPPFTLMPGNYAVKIFAGMAGIERILDSGEVLKFEVIDNFTHFSHVPQERRAGYVARPMDWEVYQVSENVVAGD